METSPFYNHDHPFLLDDYISLPNPTIESTAVVGFSNEFNLPHDQVLPIASFERNVNGNQASIGINNFQSSDSLMPMVGLDHQFETKIPTTNSSFNDDHTNDRAKDTCKRGKKKKKINVEKETKKKSDSIEEGHTGYIHVRARRGEATDSHSLAERVRREKISEKMKTLQAIVPGCDQITGKALMLDQVINYVQTLQNQVQILSLELASLNNPMLHGYGADFETYLPKTPQNMTTNQQQMPCMISQNNGEALWDFDDQRQELVDPFANINFNSFY